ncbi:MAG: NUDIX domain-containing protein [Patescibacteria group bacterium]
MPKYKTGTFISVKIYREIIKHLVICTVDVLFFNKTKDETLLFKRTNLPYRGAYFSAGGRLLKNEEFKQAAVRQMKQELGLKLDPKKLIWGGVVNEINPSSIFQGINSHTVNIFWGYILRYSHVKFDGQHSVARWFKVNDQRLHPLVKKKLRMILPNL